MERILLINEHTRAFVLSKLTPIADQISDETMIKIISLYAACEFNRYFDLIVPDKLDAKYIELSKVGNSTVYKILFIPATDLYKGINSNFVGYLAENTSVVGLALAFIFQVLLTIRFIIKGLLLSIIIYIVPFALIYIIILSDKKTTNFFKGALYAFLQIGLLTIVELGIYKICYLTTNNVNTISSLAIGTVIGGLTTLLYIILFTNIFTDVQNFGLTNFTNQLMKLRGIDPNIFNSGYADRVYNDYMNQRDRDNSYAYNRDEYYERNYNSTEYIDRIEEQMMDSGNIRYRTYQDLSRSNQNQHTENRPDGYASNSNYNRNSYNTMSQTQLNTGEQTQQPTVNTPIKDDYDDINSNAPIDYYERMLRNKKAVKTDFDTDTTDSIADDIAYNKNKEVQNQDKDNNPSWQDMVDRIDNSDSIDVDDFDYEYNFGLNDKMKKNK